MALPGKEEPAYLTAVVPYIRPCKEEGMYITGFFRPVPLARLSLPFMCHFITVSLSAPPSLLYSSAAVDIRWMRNGVTSTIDICCHGPCARCAESAGGAPAIVVSRQILLLLLLHKTNCQCLVSRKWEVVWPRAVILGSTTVMWIDGAASDESNVTVRLADSKRTFDEKTLALENGKAISPIELAIPFSYDGQLTVRLLGCDGCQSEEFPVHPLEAIQSLSLRLERTVYHPDDVGKSLPFYFLSLPVDDESYFFYKSVHLAGLLGPTRTNHDWWRRRSGARRPVRSVGRCRPGGGPRPQQRHRPVLERLSGRLRSQELAVPVERFTSADGNLDDSGDGRRFDGHPKFPLGRGRQPAAVRHQEFHFFLLTSPRRRFADDRVAFRRAGL